jgi:opacity protein-like surface antigen
MFDRFSRGTPGGVSLRLVAIACRTIVLLATASGSALAEPPPDDFSRPGWYAGLGGFYAISDYDLTTTDLGVVPPEPAATDPKFSNTAGIDARLGYRLAPHWAVEFDYQWQAGFDSSNGAINPPLEIDTHLLSLNTKLFAATGRWQPYGLLGASLLIFNTEIVDNAFKKPWSTDVGFAPRFGAGLDYYLNENWVVTAEGTYVLPVGVLDDANMASVGVSFQYRF